MKELKGLKDWEKHKSETGIHTAGPKRYPCIVHTFTSSIIYNGVFYDTPQHHFIYYDDIEEKKAQQTKEISVVYEERQVDTTKVKIQSYPAVISRTYYDVIKDNVSYERHNTEVYEL